MTEIKRLLVHPIVDQDFGPVSHVWGQWQSQPDTHTIPLFDLEGLRDVSFLDALDTESGRYLVNGNLIVGGQLTHRCIYVILDFMAHHTRVQNQEVNLQLDSHAVYPADQETIQSVVDDIFQLYAVTVNVI